ncbi:thiamine biosynthesis protein ApbE [Allgaiera indica]|uniref:Thiamine biosynthesis protein ApbE n=2 Tax=Allgaiera indica TaxID=765699 RepID=A0AAN4UPK9_9RHOB|nr:thiamine biosynthesis protein ApbE [Allgaiera indica]SDW25085.1 hypothetical protein SAMN05444006_102179 [Allgaiera indica]
MGIEASYLPDGARLHLHHGPIDLILWADADTRKAAYTLATDRFSGLLEELVTELPVLRSPAPRTPEGPVARRMAAAVAPYAAEFITPMAAVAGAVADAVLAAMADAPGLTKAHVNNGGDIAFHLAPGQSLTAAIAGAPAGLRLTADQPFRGLATSGWRGRSHSLGIADAVTVIARSAAEADAAATMIANAVNLPGHPSIIRRPACDLAPDSDLGPRLVTVDVGPLSAAESAHALDRGLAAARRYHARGLIGAALLSLNGLTRTAGAVPTPEPELAHD